MNSSSVCLIFCPLITKSLINQECRESKFSTTRIRTSDLISVLKTPLFFFFWPHMSIKKRILMWACFIRMTI